MSSRRLAVTALALGLCAASSAFTASGMGIAVVPFEVPAAASSPVAQAGSAKVDDLVRSLGSANPNERACAALALGELKSAAAAAVPALVRLLGDMTRVENLDCGEEKWKGSRNDGGPIGAFAAVALSQIGTAGVDGLLSAIGDADANVRENSAFGLGLSSSEKAVEPLVRALGDAEARVRERAAWSLGLVGDDRSVEPLAGALRDSNEEVRAQAAWALGLKGDGRSVEPLVAALGDSSTKVRSQAAWALGLRQDRRAVDGLIPLLRDGDPQLQRQAAWALGMIADRRASEPLTAALKSQDREVRKTAAWALGMIGIRGGGE